MSEQMVLTVRISCSGTREGSLTIVGPMHEEMSFKSGVERSRIQIQKFQEEHEIQKFQEEREIQCETMWMMKRQMVPRVPNLTPEPSARRIAEHELTGHAVYRSWCRHCVASKGRAHAHSSREEGELLEIGIDYGFFGRDREDVLPILRVKCRNSSTGCVGATVVDRKGASDYASSNLTAFINKSLGFNRILVRSDNGQSLLSLIERVTRNLTGVELVLMTSPEGDHQANGLAEVGVREIKAQTRILRSQLEQRLGSRAGEKDPLMSWIHVMQRIVCPDTESWTMVERLISIDVERLGNVQWWTLVSQCISDQSVRTMQCEAETRGCGAVFMWDITRDLVLRSFSRQMV